MYALLEEADGRRDNANLAVAMSKRLGRGLDEQHVVRLAEKLADQGLLAGTEHKAPPKRNPLLALRWKVLVTNPEITRRLTAPFTFLFRPWLMGPVLAGFLLVCWFVLFHKGVASATAQAFNSPGLLLLVFGLAVASAGFHELGHAAACRYGGATPAGMGVGIYLVWPAFYTDVTDAYRLPKRSRLRVDLGGLYFNAVVADLSDATGIPDLFSGSCSATGSRSASTRPSCHETTVRFTALPSLQDRALETVVRANFWLTSALPISTSPFAPPIAGRSSRWARWCRHRRQQPIQLRRPRQRSS